MVVREPMTRERSLGRPQGPRLPSQRINLLARSLLLTAECLTDVRNLVAETKAVQIILPADQEERDSLSGTDDGAVEDFDGNNASS